MVLPVSYWYCYICICYAFRFINLTIYGDAFHKIMKVRVSKDKLFVLDLLLILFTCRVFASVHKIHFAFLLCEVLNFYSGDAFTETQ